MKKIDYLLIISAASFVGIITSFIWAGYIHNSEPFALQPTAISEAVTAPVSKIKKNVWEEYPQEFWGLSIPYLRTQDFSNSSIEIVRTLGNKSNYTEYYAKYTTLDGFTIYGLLTIPDITPPSDGFPAIVFNHGYVPPSVYKTTERYNAYVDSIARANIVVFKIDMRGHDNSEGLPFGAYYDSGYVIDTLSAYEALKKYQGVNPEKVGLWGHSMSGNIVARSLAANPNIPFAIIWAGAVYTYEDLTEYGISDNSFSRRDLPPERLAKRERMNQELGEFSPQHPFWETVVPTNYLDEYKGSIHVHHAVNDTVVGIEYSRNLREILSADNVDVELFEYANGGHNIESPAYTTAMRRTVDFILSQ